MFLHLLEGDERDLFADTAWALIHVDEDLDEREESLLAELQVELGLDTAPRELRPIDDLLHRLATLESPIVRRVMLLELSGVALADEVLREAEHDLLNRIAKTLDLEKETGPFLTFVAEAQSTWQRGRQLVVGDDHARA